MLANIFSSLRSDSGEDLREAVNICLFPTWNERKIALIKSCDNLKGKVLRCLNPHFFICPSVDCELNKSVDT